MAELVPIPLPLLLRRAFLEYEREGKIFDLPKAKFFRGLEGLDLSAHFHGRRASTPLGPAAGPHNQLTQNIVLSWLGGSRIIELKTVQILDELKIPRPCIDITNIGYNVEWSQELKLEQSLGEYVKAAMLIEILKASRLLGEDAAPRNNDTVFDMSVGYNLEGISSPRVRAWMEGMKDARRLIDQFRTTLTGRWARYRDLDFPARISDTLTLSTFHGCPAGEIEGIVNFLLTEMDLHVCVKLNPTLLGRDRVAHLLYDVLGYHDIKLDEEAFAKDLQFDEALEMLPRLDRVARARGKRLSVKFSNTLVVKNHRSFFSDEAMYMSGPPLHVLTLNLVKKFREHMGATIPVSFSAGLDWNNVANAVAMNFVPVTTCTDLLRPGGYARLIRYLEKLGDKMRALEVTRLPDFVVRYAGQGEAALRQSLAATAEELRAQLPGAPAGELALARGWLETEAAPALQAWLQASNLPLDAVCGGIAKRFEEAGPAGISPAVAAVARRVIEGLEQALVDAAGALNTPHLVDETTANPRYNWEHNKGVPRKIGSKLWLYDCINCDKCVPVCPNDANFVYLAAHDEIAYDDFELRQGEPARRVPGGVLKARKEHQLANYADACNDCGNCDVFCPEDGGPYIEKPRFFGSLENYRRDAGRNGFYFGFQDGLPTLYGTIAGDAYTLSVEAAADRARFDDGAVEAQIRLSSGEVVGWKPKPGAPAGAHTLRMLPYVQLKMLMEAVRDPRRVHYVNVAELEKEAASGR